MKHTLKADGAAFTAEGTRVNPGSAAGEGSALCACGWASEPLATRAARIAAHRVHKAHPGEHVQDESVEDEPVESADLPGMWEEADLVGGESDVRTDGFYDFTNSIYAVDYADMVAALGASHGLSTSRSRIKEQQRAYRVHFSGDYDAVTNFFSNVIPIRMDQLKVAHAKWQEENHDSLKELPRNDRHRANRAFITGWGQAY